MEHRVRVELTRAGLQSADLPIVFRCLAPQRRFERRKSALETDYLTIGNRGVVRTVGVEPTS